MVMCYSFLERFYILQDGPCFKVNFSRDSVRVGVKGDSLVPCIYFVFCFPLSKYGL